MYQMEDDSLLTHLIFSSRMLKSIDNVLVFIYFSLILKQEIDCLCKNQFLKSPRTDQGGFSFLLK